MGINNEEYLNKTAKTLDNHPKINKWSVSIVSSKSLDIGMKDNHIGGIYASPSADVGNSLNIALYWKNNKRSTHSYQGKFPELNDELLTNMESQSFYDEIIPDLPNPDVLPDVKVYDPEVEKLFDNAGVLFDSLNKIKSELKDYAKNLNGSVGGGINEIFVKNSSGFDNRYKISETGFYAYADSLYGNSYQTRHLFNNKDLDIIIEDVKTFLPYYNKIANKTLLKSGNIDVIIPYDYLLSFLNFFVMSNLNGETIDTKQSAFSVEDIKSNKQIMRDDITLTIDNTKDYSSGSHKFSPMGNVAGRQDIIKNGKIMTPMLGFKYAKKFDMKPTPDILSEESFNFGNSSAIDFDKAYKDIIDGVIIDGILGLHTQDRTRGTYSLNCQSSLLIKNGEIIGKGNVIINGNFFEDLFKDKLTFVKYPISGFPGAKLKMNVTFI
jgi:PmbA protein